MNEWDERTEIELMKTKVKIWVQYGEQSLPRLGYTFENLAAWKDAKTRGGQYVKLEMLADILALGETYMPPMPWTGETWPAMAALLFGAARDMVMRAPQVFELQLFPKCGKRLHRPVGEDDFNELRRLVNEIIERQDKIRAEDRRRAEVRRLAIEKLTKEEREILGVERD